TIRRKGFSARAVSVRVPLDTSRTDRLPVEIQFFRVIIGPVEVEAELVGFGDELESGIVLAAGVIAGLKRAVVVALTRRRVRGDFAGTASSSARLLLAHGFALGAGLEHFEKTLGNSAHRLPGFLGDLGGLFFDCFGNRFGG